MGLSEKCYLVTEEIICSVCDGDIGTHKKSGITPELCLSWYQNCEMDFLITIPEDQRNDKSVFLDFPKKETFEKYDSFRVTKDVVHNEY